MRIAFSTTACPDLTLPEVARLAQRLEFDGVELLVESPRGASLACDPFLTDEDKTREMFRESGCPVLSIATPTRFDDPVGLPVVGFAISSNERGVRECKRSVALAAQLNAGLVRVHGFQVPAGETRKGAMSRIATRLRLAVDDARGTGVRVCVQNGGSFASAEDLAELVARVDRVPLGVCYAPHLGEGESMAEAIDLLGDHLAMVRIADHVEGVSVPLGDGEAACEVSVTTLSEHGFDGVTVYEFDQVWNGEPREDIEAVLAEACESLHRWDVQGRHAELASA